MITLNESNFLLYAARCYDNPQSFALEEFTEDLNRFKYLKRLFSRYRDNKDLKERLILNHLITIFNVFGVECATKLLFFKIEEQHWSSLKTFLVFMNSMPDIITNIGPHNIIYNSNIPIDFVIAKRLREI